MCLQLLEMFFAKDRNDLRVGGKESSAFFHSVEVSELMNSRFATIPSRTIS